jgi:hypothetical protein
MKAPRSYLASWPAYEKHLWLDMNACITLVSEENVVLESRDGKLGIHELRFIDQQEKEDVTKAVVLAYMSADMTPAEMQHERPFDDRLKFAELDQLKRANWSCRY